MNLIKCGIGQFARNTADKGIYLFGASKNINYMLDFYPEHKFAQRIISIIDNDYTKCGEKHSTIYGDFRITSIDELIRAAHENETVHILIMIHNAIEVIEQLNEITELSNVNCYIYNLFPFLEHFEKLPDKVLALQDKPPQIPKIIHYMWLGGNPLPERNKQMIETWRNHCPDYEIKLWNEDNYDVYKHPFLKQAYKKKAYGFVPDYARLDIVWSYGGIYIDTDVEMIKNFDSLLHNPAFIGLTIMSGVNGGGGFGAAPNNSAIREMRDTYDGIVFSNNGTKVSYSSLIETRALRTRGFIGGNKFFIAPDITVYPVEFFAPKSSMFGIPMISSNCYSIHHFNYSWAKEELRSEKIQSQEYYGRYFKNKREDHDV